MNDDQIDNQVSDEASPVDVNPIAAAADEFSNLSDSLAYRSVNNREIETLNDEQVWLDEARRGDKAAFGKLIEAYQSPVYNLAYRMLGNSGEAEEAAQEAFIRAYTRLDSYDPAHKFSTWLLSITSNFCIDQIRKRRAVLLSIDEPLPPHPALHSDHNLGPEAQYLAQEREQMVKRMLSGLAPEYREAVVLRYWYDMSYEEIAVVQDTTVSAVKSRLFRARRQLVEATEAERASVPAGAVVGAALAI